jgi:hypothetical protein
VQGARGSGLDWRDEAAYAPLLGADRSLFAWEWLRRDPLYCTAAERALSGRNSASGGDPAAGEFGLIAFERPQLTVPHARPIWTADVYSYVLSVTAGRDIGPEDLFEIGRFNPLARIVADDRGEHLLLSDGLRALRLDGPPGTFDGIRVCLRYRLEGVAAAQRPLLTLRRFLALSQTGTFPRSLYPREPRARRWILMLRTCDALAARASQREIAQLMLSRTVERPRWRSRKSNVRSQAQRLVSAARRFADGGYRALLA